MDLKKEVLAIIAVVFVLLGVLFAINIYSFMFGMLDHANSIPDVTKNIINETGLFINNTGSTVSAVSLPGFIGGITAIQVWNVSSPGTPVLLTSGNYTLNQTTGLLKNASAVVYSSVNVSYSFTSKSDVKLSSEAVTNDSLNAVKTYSAGASNQMNVVSIVIILLLLISVFVIFMKLWQNRNGNSGSSSSANFG